LIFVLALVTGALSVVSVFIRRRGASAEVRHQLAWLGYVGLMTAMWAVVLLIYLQVTNGANGWLGTLT
jgi:hypothetical protein